MFGREAILPLDAALELESSAFPGSAKTYPEYVVQQKLQVEVTEQLVRENLKQAQKSQKAYYDTTCYGQRFHAGDHVWYRNRTSVRRKKFLKPWCGPWKVTKALSDVTCRIEEEKRKPGRCRQRRVVHFNYLKPCHSPPQGTLSPSLQELSFSSNRTPARCSRGCWSAYGDDYEPECKFLESYSKDVDTGMLPGKNYFRKSKTIFKLLAVNPANSAVGEHFFVWASKDMALIHYEGKQPNCVNGHK
ncbi:hypothetical protein ACROYT_G005275 [Oculina patagonica]